MRRGVATTADQVCCTGRRVETGRGFDPGGDNDRLRLPQRRRSGQGRTDAEFEAAAADIGVVVDDRRIAVEPPGIGAVLIGFETDEIALIRRAADERRHRQDLVVVPQRAFDLAFAVFLGEDRTIECSGQYCAYRQPRVTRIACQRRRAGGWAPIAACST